MQQNSKHLIFLCLIAGAVFFTNLGKARLWDRDEPRNAGCAKEMLERGDWVVPIFNDELRAQKPVLLYWLMMSAYSLFGVNEFAARFWSALLGLGTVVGTYAIGTRLFDSRVGFLAGIVLSTTIMFDVAARAATPDSLLIFCGTMALMIYALSVFPKKHSTGQNDANLKLGNDGVWFPSRWPAVLGTYFFLGLGTLAKGPVGFVLPMAMIGMLMLLARSNNDSSAKQPSSPANYFWGLTQSVWRTINPAHFVRTLWAMRPITGVLVILCVAFPWYLAVGLRTDGDFLNLFFLKENIARATTAMENHSGGIWYYPVAILMGFFPWSVFAVPTAMYVFRFLKQNVADEKKLRAAQFLVCWLLVQIGMFSLASTKLPSYVTPCYPAVAIMVAASLVAFISNAKVVSDLWYKLASGTLVVAGVGVLAGTLYVSQTFLGNDFRIVPIALIPIVGGVVCCWLIMRNQKRLAVISFTACSVLLTVGMFGFGTVFVNQFQTSQSVLDVMSGSDQEVATFGCMESSWVFYADRRIYELGQHPHLKTYTKVPERANFWDRKPCPTPETFVAAKPGCLILTTDEKSKELLSRLPGYDVVKQTDYFLKNSDLVLIGPRAKKSESLVQRPRESDFR